MSIVNYMLLVAIALAGLGVHSAQSDSISCGRRQLKAQSQTEAPVTPEPSFHRPVMFVIGGGTSDAGKWPWQAAFFYNGANGTTTYGCGGSLISNQWIITAAHCINYKLSHVRLGDTHVNATPSEGAVDVKVQNQIPHPNYQTFPNQLKYDLGLVYLSEPVQFTDKIQPICLTDDDTIYEYKDVHISGWGFTVPYEPTSPPSTTSFSSVLKDAAVSLVSHFICKANYAKCPGNAYNDILAVDGPKAPEISERVLCARGSGGESCTGDSGGPLVFRKSENDSFYLGGVVSFNCGCGDAKWPGGFTRVTSYIDWIASMMAEAPSRHNPRAH